MMRCQIAHVALLVVGELGQKSPFPAADLEARPAPLPMMASVRDHGARSRGGSPHRDHHELPSHRIGTDASSSRAFPPTR
jgi:hypothetical protein